MSQRRPHLRNRKNIKVPSRFEGEDVITSSPRQESHEESAESSELEEEIYESPKPKKPKPKRAAYRGKVIEYNPNLPPAAFPTLDHPSYVHNGGNVAFDLGSLSPGFQDQLADSLSRGCQPEQLGPMKDLPTMTSNHAEIARRRPQDVRQASIAAQKGPQSGMLSSLHGEPTDNGPRNPIWTSNMARIAAAGRMSDLDRIMLEMESSDEEDAASRPAKPAGSPKFAAWDDLSVAHKLELADTVTEFYPDPSQVVHQLRLSLAQKEELFELLAQRRDRIAREEANQQRLQEQTKNFILQGGRLSQLAFHQMVVENLYERIDEDDHLHTNSTELKKARAYMRYCGFDPALADNNWDIPSISNIAKGTKSRHAQSRSETISSSIAAQSSPNPSESPFSRRPALQAPSQKDSYRPDRCIEPMHQYKMSQHRPTPAHLIAQHSPAAPLSQVPVQSYQTTAGSQRRDLRARYQGTMRVPQPRPSDLQARPNAPASAETPAINDARQKANNASVSSQPQGEQPLPAVSRSIASKGLSMAQKDHKRQTSANANAGASALHGD